MRDYAKETQLRVQWIKDKIKAANADGIVFGNSGGKDCALVGILCKKACAKTIGIIMPCQSKQNYTTDMQDAKRVSEQYGIESRTVDITAAKEELLKALDGNTNPNYKKTAAFANINPRLRMTTLYAIAQTENCLVAGTGNRSECTMGYFTKWGDGAYDLNPIGDLTVREVYEFLAYFDAPMTIRTKKPSAGLWAGQTDEQEMGLTYKEIDDYLLLGEATPSVTHRIESAVEHGKHKRVLPVYPD